MLGKQNIKTVQKLKIISFQIHACWLGNVYILILFFNSFIYIIAFK
jgi:hypothetical protein